MFSEIRKKRMQKWENVVISNFVESFENCNWKQFHLREVKKAQHGNFIEVIPAKHILKIANDLLKQKEIDFSISGKCILVHKTQTTITHVNIATKCQRTLHTLHDNDLIFIKEPNEEEQQTIDSFYDVPKFFVKKEKVKPKELPSNPKPPPKEREDPLRSWCQKFLNEYSENKNVDQSLETVPHYKPSQNQILKLQKKREKELLKWGNQF